MPNAYSRRTHGETILVLVPEPHIRDLIASSLTAAGYYPMVADSVDGGQMLALQVAPDALLIDMDAAPDSASLIGLVRDAADHRHAPVLMLTRDMATLCNASANRCPADECISKPFVPRDLVSRLSAHLHHRVKERAEPQVVRVGLLELDAKQRRLRYLGADKAHDLFLSGSECRLLQWLMARPDKVHARLDILRSVWGAEEAVDARTVDQNIRRLRETLGRLGLIDAIQTVRGVGYRLALRPASRPVAHHVVA